MQHLRTHEMNVRVNGARRHNKSVARHDFGRRPDHQIRMHAVHGVGVAGLAQCHDTAVPDSHIGFDNAPVIENNCAGNHQIRGALRTCGTRLPH